MVTRISASDDSAQNPEATAALGPAHPVNKVLRDAVNNVMRHLVNNLVRQHIPGRYARATESPFYTLVSVESLKRV